jgi:Periplasmic component of the Tol biopolymer transport system
MSARSRVGAALAWIALQFAVPGAWSGVVQAAPGDTELVSLGATGTAVGAGAPAISANGRFVAFISYAPVVSGDTNGAADVFVRDRWNGTVERVNVPSSGAQADDGSEHVELSGDGRFVVFTSYASNLVPDDTNGQLDIFVRDRQAGTTERVNLSSTGQQTTRYQSFQPGITPDGRFVVFVTQANNLVANDTNNSPDIFVHDRSTHTTVRVNLTSGEQQADFGISWNPAISRDGRYVAFDSEATNLVAGDTNGVFDVFVRDRLNGVTERVNVAPAGGQANGGAGSASISGDGRYVAFVSGASNLVANDTGDIADVFVRDRTTGTTVRASVSTAGEQADSTCFEPVISADGRSVAYTSFATNLVPRDSNGVTDVFLRDLAAGTTERVSVASDGAQAAGESRLPAIDADGQFVAFTSSAKNLAPHDSNAIDDVYVHETGGPSSGPENVQWSLLPKSQDFGVQTVDTLVWRRFKLENLGNVPLPFTARLIGRDVTAFAMSHACGTAVPVAQTCVIRVAFNPTTTGDKTATLRVIAGPNDTVRDRPLTGTGVPGKFSVSPTSIAFGGVAVGSASDVHVVTITNTGLGSLPLPYHFDLAGPRPGQFVRHDNCASGLAPGQSCTVDVYFVPKLKGPLSAVLVITAGGQTSPKSVTLTGKGL